MKPELAQIFDAMLDIAGVLNRPQPDRALVALAGVELDPALLTLFVRIYRRGPLGIGELAELSGRDHTTVSRQVVRLAELDLVLRRAGERDARVTEPVVTELGARLAAALDEARERRLTTLLSPWSEEDVATLARLLGRLAEDLVGFVRRDP